jgi:hypothetical protein
MKIFAFTDNGLAFCNKMAVLRTNGRVMITAGEAERGLLCDDEGRASLFMMTVGFFA